MLFITILILIDILALLGLCIVIRAAFRRRVESIRAHLIEREQVACARARDEAFCDGYTRGQRNMEETLYSERRWCKKEKEHLHALLEKRKVH